MVGRTDRRDGIFSSSLTAMGATAIIQARMGSTRLPGKVLKPLVGHPLLWHVVQQVRATQGLAEIVVATPDTPADDAIRAFCAREGVAVFSGDEDDVLDRYYQAARSFAADPVVRVTSDCPLVDPALIGRLLTLFEEGGYDYASLAVGGPGEPSGANGYPDGMDVECFSFAALEQAWSEASEPADREHVTPYLLRDRQAFRCGWLVAEQDWSGIRVTVDEPEDFVVVEHVYEALYREGEPPFSLEDILRVLARRPDLAEINRGLMGKEKYRDLWGQLADRDEQGEKGP